LAPSFETSQMTGGGGGVLTMADEMNWSIHLGSLLGSSFFFE